MILELQKLIEEAYIQCELEVLGLRPAEIDVRIIRNHIIIIKGIPTIEESISSASIRGKNIHKILSDIKREQFHALLTNKLTQITGCHVAFIQSDICIDSGEKMEMVHFDCDLESKFIGD